MIPDWPLFVPLPPSYATTHSLPGLFTACLPLGFVGFMAFQAVMKQPLIALLPAPVRCRCAAIATPSPAATVPAALSVALAVTIGAATRVIWDAFTHQGRWGTRLVPWLDTTVLTVAGHAVPGYKLMQYGSTAVGLPLLAALAVVWLRRQAPAPLDSLPSLPLAVRVLAVPAALGVPAILTWYFWATETAGAYDRLGRSIRVSGLALSVVVLGYCFAFRAMAGRQRRLVRTVRSFGSEHNDSSGPTSVSLSP
jgi:hypothetical protein